MAASGCERRAVSALGVQPQAAEPLFLLPSVSAGLPARDHPGEMGGRPHLQFKQALGALPFEGSLGFSGDTFANQLLRFWKGWGVLAWAIERGPGALTSGPRRGGEGPWSQ